MKKPSLPFLIILFIAGALVHKGLAKKGSFIFANNSLTQEKTVNTPTSFRKIAEPATINNQSSFSIHKIVSSTIYYELHIQKNDHLETWKIFKGPSCNPLQKRKMLKKENLPLEYLLFEGTLLKEKTYKEGILVWDYGTYSFYEAPTENKYTIIFNGTRMKGLYMLEKKHNDWILSKQEDAFADTHRNMTRLFTKSALSGLTLTQILHRIKDQHKE